MPDPIPVRVGDRTVRLAQDCGVSRISKILRVGYYPLKERVEREKDPAACCSESPPDVTFVEREPPATSQGWAQLCRQRQCYTAHIFGPRQAQLKGAIRQTAPFS